MRAIVSKMFFRWKSSSLQQSSISIDSFNQRKIIVMKGDSTLYDFLKKNAAYSSQAQSSRRDSEFQGTGTFNQGSYFNNNPGNNGRNQMKEIKLFQDNNQINRDQNKMMFSNNSSFTFGGSNYQKTNYPQQRQEQPLINKSTGQMFRNGSLDKDFDKRSVNSSFSHSSQSSNFQSARMEASECLNNLSRQIQSELGSIDQKIQNFKAGLQSMLISHFKNVRDTLYRLIDTVIKESERNLLEFKKRQEQKLAGQLIQIKSALQKQYMKVETMKTQMNRANWRKIAGEIISSELEQRVFDLLDRSAQINFGQQGWMEKTTYHMRQIQNHLRQCLRMQ